jgi:hypothetical protein
LLDALAGIFGHIRPVIDHPGNRLGGDPGGSGNLLDRRTFVMSVHNPGHLRSGDTVIVIGNDNIIAKISLLVK